MTERRNGALQGRRKMDHLLMLEKIALDGGLVEIIVQRLIRVV